MMIATTPRKLAGLALAFAASFGPGGAARANAAELPVVPLSALAPAPFSVAVVVGSNHSPSSKLQDLKYGDDDAVQNARTFSMLGADTTLLVAPDAETRDLFPSTKPQGAATNAELRAAFTAAKSKLAAAHASGRPTDLYFLFAGHGDLAEGRPFLQLDDARLYREDLADMLRAAGADENHVVVDACYGAAFVSDRGPGGERERLPAGFTSGTSAVWPARTGFLTARSSGGQTHEWAEYQSGIFSHELRSGLAGAADVNVDGKVTYRELAAFVKRANEAIPNRRYRPELSTTPPAGNLDATLALLPEGPIVLEMDVQPAGRAFVETETGIRLVDLHAAAGPAIQLRLPTDLGSLFVEQETTPNVSTSLREFRLQPHAGHVRLSALATDTPHVSARGAGHEAFMHLFARAFDAEAATAFTLDEDTTADLKWMKDAQDAEHARVVRKRLAIGAVGLGVASGVTAGAFWLSGHNIYEANKDPNRAAEPGATTKLNRRYDTAYIFGGVAAASLATGAILWFWHDAPAVTVASTPGCEACLAYSRSF
ncbi:MAG: hypothetical protein JWM82_1337 [Myxococcales bacterium]|jgi:hypothetical protein|nr:hypothetical protein [Myxococcales bacterium]